MVKNEEKIYYEVDPHNRLVVKDLNGLSLTKFRQVFEGKFSVDKQNNLIYLIKESSGQSIPQQIKFSGTWSLDQQHNLVFTLDKWNNQCEGNKLVIKGELLDVNSHGLSFIARTSQGTDNTSIYVLQLNGFWQVDKNNRLSFSVERKKSFTDVLTFSGSWQLNKQNEIIYTYTKIGMKRKEKLSHELVFKGNWSINEDCRLVYQWQYDLTAKFEFTAEIIQQLPSGLQYSLKLGAKPITRIIEVAGQFKLNKKTGLIFEVKSQQQKINSIMLGAVIKLGKTGEFEARLTNKSGEDLGVKIKLSRKIFSDSGEVFLNALRDGRELAIMAGAAWRF